jgi:hypothetical protein
MRWHESILEYKRGRYLKVALLLSAVAIAAYVWHQPHGSIKPYGGTWLGYTLGTIGAVLILWLMWLGVRRRRYGRSIGAVQAWTSAHVYLGTSLLVIATLHAGFEFGVNLHTLVYALMVGVIFSGFFGVYAYLRYPRMLTENLSGEAADELVQKIADLDRRCRQLALELPDEINAIVAKASRAGPREVATGRQRLRLPGFTLRNPAREACKALTRVGTKFKGEQAVQNGRLLTEMTRKSVLIDQVRRDARLRRLLKAWLMFHVPLSFGLLGALIAHTVSVFFFW